MSLLDLVIDKGIEVLVDNSRAEVLSHAMVIAPSCMS
jgi:hypothetical protein